MPTYEYQCEAGHDFEAFQKMSDAPLTECPECGARAQRRISAGAGLVFKGSGFYITDYKNKKPASEKSGGDGASDGQKAEASPSPKSEGSSGGPKSKPDAKKGGGTGGD